MAWMFVVTGFIDLASCSTEQVEKLHLSEEELAEATLCCDHRHGSQIPRDQERDGEGPRLAGGRERPALASCFPCAAWNPFSATAPGTLPSGAVTGWEASRASPGQR